MCLGPVFDSNAYVLPVLALSAAAQAVRQRRLLRGLCAVLGRLVSRRYCGGTANAALDAVALLEKVLEALVEDLDLRTLALQPT